MERQSLLSAFEGIGCGGGKGCVTYQEGAFVQMTWGRFLKRGGGVFGAFYRAGGVEACECVRELVRLYVRLLSVVGYSIVS